MRFDSARAAGLNEERVGRIADGYEAALEPAQVVALKLTDAIIGVPQTPGDEVQQALMAHYSEAEIVEIALGVGLFLGMSKVLINLGLEPEDMPVTVVPTPGQAG